jgi:hypothetical protein
MASRKSDGSDAWRGAAARPNGALAYGGPAYAAPGQYAAPPPPAVEQPWLVLVGGTDQRQVQASELRAAVQSGAVTRETLVWRAGMSSWAPIGSIAELVPPEVSAASWQAAPAAEPTSARRAAEQYLSAHGPGLGDTTTYAAWDPPEGRIPLRREPPPAANITSELIATGMVVFGIVMFTLYMISLGGAFEAGSHSPGSPASGAASDRAHAAK